MATYIKTLKEDNGDITYPQTVGGAVLLTGGSDLETTLAAKANTADLAGVATTGSYNNLTDKPTIPTQTSQLTNNSGFITSSSLKDANITWGGPNLTSNMSPDDMGCVDEFSHNKLAFLPASCINVAYSTNGGSTWTDYGLTDAQKIAMVTTAGSVCYVGGSTAATSSNIANLRLRIRIACGPTSGGVLYTAAKKILINVNTNGATGDKVAIRYRTIANYVAGTETWSTPVEYAVSGGSGWNSIPFNYTWGGSFTSQTGQIGQFEFVFSCTGLGTWGQYKLGVTDFRLIGFNNWSMPSDMAKNGHLYTFDTSKNATFPANVKVGGSLQHGNYTYTLPSKTGTVAMTSDIPTVASILLAAYPVGSIYMSATLDTVAKVQNALGGTWVKWGAGRVPVGVDTSDTDFNTVEKTGGEKTHTLVKNEMPSHGHEVYGRTGSTAAGSNCYQGRNWNGTAVTTVTGNQGGDQPHNNLQPYITCYMYKRTA